MAVRDGILSFEEGIGNWRMTNKSINFPTNKYKFIHNSLIEIQKIENETIDVVDEWDTKATCKQVEELNPCMIRAKFAGSGKSYIGQYFKKMGKNVLFVVPHNRLSQEIEGDSTTYNMFFRIPVHKGDELPEFDHREFDVIFLYEVYMTNLYIYSKFLNSTEKHKNNKLIIGAGDCNQLPPISDLTNTQPHDKYADQCMDKIFKYNKTSISRELILL